MAQIQFSLMNKKDWTSITLANPPPPPHLPTSDKISFLSRYAYAHLLFLIVYFYGGVRGEGGHKIGLISRGRHKCMIPYSFLFF